MGMADIAEVLWRDVLKFNPGNPTWSDRDRFVLSNGHASMLLYSVLHLTGYSLSMDEIRQFRQFGSKTPGHPEREPHLGIETTTGPLGQGLANAVGMALAERALAATFNRPGHTIVDHHTYAFCGDGCLMEGISHEISSLAGTQQLGKLIVVYDHNGISIDGKVLGWFADDTVRRFEAYGWHVLSCDGQDSDAVAAALAAARAVTDKPSFISAKTTIGWGAPNKQGTAAMHGEAMGAEEIAATRKFLHWNSPPFEIPAEIRAAWDMREKGARAEQQWRKQFAAYKLEFPALAAEYERRMSGDLPDGFAALAQAYIGGAQAEGKSLATRQSSQATLNVVGPNLPELFGGSADLTPSNGTLRKDSIIVTPATPAGNYVHFGVREFGMSAILNGMVAHGGFIAYGGTFLTFSDYARNALRMAALMRLRVVFVYTHDSIGLGEDGPTHQPIEHLAALRVIPHMDVWADLPGVDPPIRLAPGARRRTDGRHRARRLCVDRQRGPAGSNRDRHRLRSGHCRGGGAQFSRQGAQAAPGVHAQRHHLRTSRRRLQGKRAAQGRDAPSRGRGGSARALVALRRPAGPDCRHRPLRRLGARQGAVSGIRLHAAARDRGDRHGAGRLNIESEGRRTQ